MSLLRGTSIVAGLTLISRALGFLRDVAIAGVFGASLLTDIFFVAFRIPNLLRSIVAEGALTSAFVPVFSHVVEKENDSRQSVFSSMFALLLCITSLLVVLGFVFASEIVSIVAPGFSSNPEAFANCVSLTRIMLPYIMFISCIALVNGALNSINIFGAAPIAQITMNICLALGALIAFFFDPAFGIEILSYSVLLGGLMQVIAQLPFLKRAGLNLIPALPLLTKHTRKVLALMVPAILGAAAYQISILLTTLLASLLPSGSVSWLFYSDRLSQLSIGIFSVSLGSVLLPTLSRAVADNNKAVFSRELINALRYSSFILVPVSGFLFIFSEDLISLLFGRGQFSNYDSLQTGLALKAASLGLWGVGCYYLCIRALLAHKDTVTPSLFGILHLVLTISIALITMGVASPNDSDFAASILQIKAWLENIFPSIDLRHSGLALSAGLSNLALFPALLITVALKQKSFFSIQSFLVTSIKIFVATLFAMYCLSVFNIASGNNFIDFACNSLIFLIIILIFAKILKLNELTEVTTLLKNRLNKAKK